MGDGHGEAVRILGEGHVQRRRRLCYLHGRYASRRVPEPGGLSMRACRRDAVGQPAQSMSRGPGPPGSVVADLHHEPPVEH